MKRLLATVALLTITACNPLTITHHAPQHTCYQTRTQPVCVPYTPQGPWK